MTGKSIIAVGHAGLDYVYQVDAFPAGPTKLRARSHIASGGGMAANAAAAIARLGGQVALWGRIGDDRKGAEIADQLSQAGVGISVLRIYRGVRSPTSAVIVDSKGERIVISEDDRGLPVAADWLPLSDVAAACVVFSDLTWREGTLAAFGEARRTGSGTVLDIDLGCGCLLDEVIGLTDYAIFSAPAFQRFVQGDTDHDRFAELMRRGVRHAGVTRGSHGYDYVHADGAIRHCDAFSVDVVDTTGAGDAFHGAFCWALNEGLKDEDCARIASAVAALSCRRLGARSGLPDREELQAFLAGRAGRDFHGKV